MRAGPHSAGEMHRASTKLVLLSFITSRNTDDFCCPRWSRYLLSSWNWTGPSDLTGPSRMASVSFHYTISNPLLCMNSVCSTGRGGSGSSFATSYHPFSKYVKSSVCFPNSRAQQRLRSPSQNTGCQAHCRRFYSAGLGLGLGLGLRSVFLVSSQVMLMLLAQGLHFENH